MSSLIDTAVEHLEVFLPTRPRLQLCVHITQLLQAYCYLLTPVAFRGLLVSSGATLLILEDHKCLGVYLTSPSWCPATDGLGLCCGTKSLYPSTPEFIYRSPNPQYEYIWRWGPHEEIKLKCSINGGALIR